MDFSFDCFSGSSPDTFTIPQFSSSHQNIEVYDNFTIPEEVKDLVHAIYVHKQRKVEFTRLATEHTHGVITSEVWHRESKKYDIKLEKCEDFDRLRRKINIIIDLGILSFLTTKEIAEICDGVKIEDVNFVINELEGWPER